MSYDVEKLRQDFPILSQTVYKKPLVYLDNGATTQKPQCVIDCMTDVYTRINSNIHRGVHHLSNLCTDAFEQARRTVARFVNAQSDSEIVFVRGTTEGVNLLAYSFGETFCHEGDEIVITAMEHHANIVPWQLLCQRKKMQLRVAPIDERGELIEDELYALLSSKTKLISIAHVSNVMGTINPVEKIIRRAHELGIAVAVDAAQSVPHTAIDVQALDCDFLMFSGHKMYAPNGSGALYGKRKFLEQMVPYHGGGEMIEKVTFEHTTFNALPFKFEAGTPDYVAAIALGKAIEYLEKIGMQNIAQHEKALGELTRTELGRIAGIRFIGEAEQRSSTVSFLLGNVHPYDTGMILDKMGIAVRTGHHCAQPLMERYGISGTVRASFGLYNTEAEVMKLVDGVKRVAAMMGM